LGYSVDQFNSLKSHLLAYNQIDDFQDKRINEKVYVKKEACTKEEKMNDPISVFYNGGHDEYVNDDYDLHIFVNDDEVQHNDDEVLYEDEVQYENEVQHDDDEVQCDINPSLLQPKICPFRVLDDYVKLSNKFVDDTVTHDVKNFLPDNFSCQHDVI